MGDALLGVLKVGEVAAVLVTALVMLQKAHGACWCSLVANGP